MCKDCAVLHMVCEESDMEMDNLLFTLAGDGLGLAALLGLDDDRTNSVPFGGTFSLSSSSPNMVTVFEGTFVGWFVAMASLGIEPLTPFDFDFPTIVELLGIVFLSSPYTSFEKYDSIVLGRAVAVASLSIEKPVDLDFLPTVELLRIGDFDFEVMFIVRLTR
jgi:hypothetical protein